MRAVVLSEVCNPITHLGNLHLHPAHPPRRGSAGLMSGPFRLMFTETSLGFAVTPKDFSMPLLLGMERAFGVCVRNTMRFVVHARRGGMA